MLTYWSYIWVSNHLHKIDKTVISGYTYWDKRIWRKLDQYDRCANSGFLGNRKIHTLSVLGGAQSYGKHIGKLLVRDGP